MHIYTKHIHTKVRGGGYLRVLFLDNDSVEVSELVGKSI